tara:strand:- start:119 stop:727 length:609 start_codon:yes stop_codon:yes gene_type:complete
MKITRSQLRNLIRETFLQVFEDADADADADTDTDGDLDTGDTDAEEDTGSPSVPRDKISMPVDMNWVSWGNFAILPYDDVMMLEELPLSLESPQQKLAKYESKNWRIKELYKHCLGKGAGAVHGYSDQGYDTHPDLKRKMLPPGWTLAMSALIVKIEDAEVRLSEKKSVLDKEKYAKSHGFNRLEDLEEVIDAVMEIDSKYF